MVKLSKRLRAAAGMVIPGSHLADVGTDHAWVPIYLVQTGAIPSALAMDIGTGPLQRAREHIEENGLPDKIKCRLSDGLAAYDKGECDTVLIAGMGGELIIDILTKGREKLTAGMQLILSPHTHTELVREYIDSCGYKLVDEICVYDEGKYYFLMDVRMDADYAGSKGYSRFAAASSAGGYTPADRPEGGGTDGSEDGLGYEISRILVKKKDPLYLEYLKTQMDKYKKILENQGLGVERKSELRALLEVYTAAVDMMQGT